MRKKREDKRAYMSSPDWQKRSVLSSKSSFAAVEAYKSARTNLLFTKAGVGCQKIIITSTFQSEGKSVNCINLGITLAQNGLRVLIVDADMRRPVVQRVLGLQADKGLSELLAQLAGNDENGAAPLILRTEYENLYVLPAGRTPPNPAELLASPRMEMLLKELEQHFDYIMIDTPPISVVTDALVLAKLVDGYIFVVRANRTPMDGLREAVARMEQVGANLLGFILNDVEIQSSYGKYKRYKHYGKYGYYHKYGYYKYGYSHENNDVAQQQKEHSGTVT